MLRGSFIYFKRQEPAKEKQKKQTNTKKQDFGNILVILIAVLNKKCCCCTSFIEVFFMFWLLVIISESVMHPFFLSRNISEWRANEMSENGLKMACGLRLCLHINIVHSRRNQRQDSWLAHISPLKYKIRKGHFCRLQNYGYSLRGYDK